MDLGRDTIMKKQKQWNHVKHRYTALNKLIEEGKLVIQCHEDSEPEIIDKVFTIVEKNKAGFPAVYYCPYENVIHIKYEHDPEWDHGYYNTIEELNKMLFDNIKVFEPIGKVF